MTLDELVEWCHIQEAMEKKRAPQYAAHFAEAASRLLAMKEALEDARPHVVNASVGVVPPNEEEVAFAALKRIDALLSPNRSGGGDE